MQPTAHCTYKSEYKKGSDYAKSYKIQHGIIQEVILKDTKELSCHKVPLKPNPQHRVQHNMIHDGMR